MATSQAIPRAVRTLIDELSKLPGIGPKSASRLTYYLLRADRDQAERLGVALSELRANTQFCSVCYNITESDPCPVCSDDQRQVDALCVVEEPLDVLALERARAYHGRYHVLHGLISPINGIGPDQLRIRELLQRVASARPAIKEVILATNPTMEGESTAMYLQSQLEKYGVRITRLARGLPVGGDLEYADATTLARALEERQSM